MNKETAREVALVTGASKGIGAAIALELAQNGFDIWLNYRSDSAAACTFLPERQRCRPEGAGGNRGERRRMPARSLRCRRSRIL